MDRPLLDIRDLSLQFDTRFGAVHALNGVSLHVHEGETLGIVGESGSGKSVTAMSIQRLVPMPPARMTGGEIWFQGRDLLQLGSEAIRRMRGSDIAMIFQDPSSALNPVLTIGKQLDEILQRHTKLSKAERRSRALELLEMVEMPSSTASLRKYPHQYSGGMRQRVMIAIALACSPKLLIADEPTTALDVTTQAQIIDLLKTLCDEQDMALVIITHDIGVVSRVADRVTVMYAGRVIESGPSIDVLEEPFHPYTDALIRAVPTVERGLDEELMSIPGSPPDMRFPPQNCAFYARCQHRKDDRCADEIPPLRELRGGRSLACFYSLEQGAEA